MSPASRALHVVALVAASFSSSGCVFFFGQPAHCDTDGNCPSQTVCRDSACVAADDAGPAPPKGPAPLVHDEFDNVARPSWSTSLWSCGGAQGGDDAVAGRVGKLSLSAAHQPAGRFDCAVRTQPDVDIRVDVVLPEHASNTKRAAIVTPRRAVTGPTVSEWAFVVDDSPSGVFAYFTHPEDVDPTSADIVDDQTDEGGIFGLQERDVGRFGRQLSVRVRSETPDVEHMRGKVWTQGDVEPTEWLIDVQFPVDGLADGTHTSTLGVAADDARPSGVDAQFDNFAVYDPTVLKDTELAP